MTTTHLIKVNPDEIDRIKAHLATGHQAAIVTVTRTTKLTKSHVDYIRASGKGYRIGWPGKSSVFVFADYVALVPPGYTI